MECVINNLSTALNTLVPRMSASNNMKLSGLTIFIDKGLMEMILNTLATQAVLLETLKVHCFILVWQNFTKQCLLTETM